MRLWLSLSLTPMLALAGFASAQESGCLSKKISASHHALQQGGDIELSVKLGTKNCGLPIDVKNPTKTTEISVQVEEGFVASHPVVEISGFENAPVGSTWMGHTVTARFTVHAFREASVGEHWIPATLTYTAQEANRNIASRILALNIPVKVTEPPQPGFWDEHPEAGKTFVTTGEVLLLIIVMPFWIIGSMLGFFQWDC